MTCVVGQVVVGAGIGMVFYGVGLGQLAICGVVGVGMAGYLVWFGKLVCEGRMGLDVEDEVKGVVAVWGDVARVGRSLVWWGKGKGK